MILKLNDGDVMDDFLSFTASRLPAAVCFFFSAASRKSRIISCKAKGKKESYSSAVLYLDFLLLADT